MSACVCLCLHVSVYLPLFSGEFVCVWEDQKSAEAVKFQLWYLDKNFFSCLKSYCVTNECRSSHYASLYMHAHHTRESVYFF